MRPLHRADRHLAERGQDVVVERAPVDARGVGVAMRRDVDAHVPFGEIGHRGFVRRGGRIQPRLESFDDRGRPLARPFGSELAVGAQRHAPGRAARAGLHHIDLSSARIGAHPEPGQLAVPDYDVPVMRFERADRSRTNRPGVVRFHRSVDAPDLSRFRIFPLMHFRRAARRPNWENRYVFLRHRTANFRHRGTDRRNRVRSPRHRRCAGAPGRACRRTTEISKSKQVAWVPAARLRAPFARSGTAR